MPREDPVSDLSNVVSAARSAVIEVMEHGVIVLDSEDCVLDINPTALGIVGQSARDVIGQPLSALSAEGFTMVEALKETGEATTEVTVERPEAERVFEIRCLPLGDRRGQSMGRAVFLRDITERRRVERALRKTKEAAEASNQAKSDFMSVASHEMRTPITSIKGYTDLLARGTVGPVNERQSDFLDTIRANVDRIALLVSDLSDIARIESGRLSLELGPVDLADVVRDAVRSLRTQIEEKNQALRVQVPDDLPVVQADHARLMQVLSNLLSNAHKFTPAGGCITVRADRRPRSEPRADGVQEEEILVTVEDDGIGIKAHEKTKVFEKFYRSEDREASDMPGSGLGLSIAANLVEMQGGRIWLDSVFREGTTVSFALPITEPSPR